MTMEHSCKYVGKPLVAIDAERKVRGEALYAGDLDIGYALVGKLVRSPHAHARICRIDTSRARKVEGVKTIITADDLPDVRMGFGIGDQPILARGIVRHVGEPVAAIAGLTERACEEAARLVEIEFDPLPAVFDAEQAIAEDQKILVHPELSEYPWEKHRSSDVWQGKWPPELGRPNINGCWGLRRGDVEKGFLESDLIVENTFRTAATQHAAIEPHGAVARPEPDGSLTLWSATRSVSKIQHEVAKALQVPQAKVHMVTMDVGGSFGGKSEGKTEAIVAWLARLSRMPVRLLIDREGEFVTATKHEFTIKMKDGVSRDGIIKARKIEVILNGGAYSGAPVHRNCTFALQTYKLENVEVNSYRAYTNLPMAMSYRGFGVTDVTTAIEQQMDIIAEKLGLDAVELRLKNLCVQGDINNLGERMQSFGSRECLLRVSEAIRPFRETSGRVEGSWRRGFGIAVGQKYSEVLGESHCEVRLEPDGAIEVFVGGMDTGQGYFTAMTQIAAEEMDTPVEKIRVRGRELGLTPIHDSGALSSRQTFNTGNAIRLALIDLKKKLFALVHKSGEAPQDLRYSNGAIYAQGISEPLLRISDLFKDRRSYPGRRKLLRTLSDGGELVGKAVWVVEPTPIDPRDSRFLGEDPKKEPRLNPSYTPAAVAAEVMVNVETGAVRVIRLFCAVEGGKIVNPILAEGQVEGAACMGLGAALMEETYKDGVVRAHGFIDYPLPTTMDIPTAENFKLFLLESPQPDGPFGAKGVGEASLVVVPGAIANAVSAAIGRKVKVIPITPERVLAALAGGESKEETVFCFSRPLVELVSSA